MTHTAEHECLLERLITGDLAPVPEPIARELRDCARCAVIFDETVRLQRTLADGGERQRVVLALARTLSNAPGEARVEALLRERLLASTSESRPRHARRRWLWALAAGVLLAFAIGLGVLRREESASDVRMLGGELEALAPAGQVTRNGLHFAWQSRLPAGIRYRLVVEGRVAPDDAWVELVDVERLRETEWSPGPEAAVRWPDVVRWRAIAYDAAGSRLAETGWLQVSLSH